MLRKTQFAQDRRPAGAEGPAEFQPDYTALKGRSPKMIRST
jgi:hypothetical protein